MPWKLLILLLRGLAAMIIGYAVIAVLTSAGFHAILGGHEFYGSTPLQLLAGTLLAIFSGLIGGVIAGFIGPMRGVFNAALVLVLLTVDTTYVLFFWKSTAPIWFDAMGSGTLMLFTLLGGLVTERIKGRREKCGLTST